MQPKHTGLSRREFIAGAGGCLAIGAAHCIVPVKSARGDTVKRPNVVLIITDDQGWGDLGCHGNPDIRTPVIDRFAGESTEFVHFYVLPVCAPTRASLLTGRYNFRTGVTGTYLGRSLLAPDEVTVAELFAEAGYRTGIFGKWHLGDSYPMRPGDQGFHESLVHHGAAIGQPSGPPGNSYFDPVLIDNGSERRFGGYVTDIFTDAAVSFIERDITSPFFALIAYNSPHIPLQVPEEYVKPYRDCGLTESTARYYGMCTNVDENVGRVLEALRSSGIENDTVVIFMTDNGPQFTWDQTDRFTAGLRGRKATMYDGGIRVPFFIRWPGRFGAGVMIDSIAAHIDVLPTLLDACSIAIPGTPGLDGKSLLPLLSGGREDWPDRMVFFQWNGPVEPKLYSQFAVRSQRYKLVQPANKTYHSRDEVIPDLELYDMDSDPGETKNVASEHPALVMDMLGAYEDWFRDVSLTRGYGPVRIYIGSPHQNPVTLTRQDWQGPGAGWNDGDLGYWEIRVVRSGSYVVTLRFPETSAAGYAHVMLGNRHITAVVEKAAVSCGFEPVALEAGDGRLHAWVTIEGKASGAHYVDIASGE